MTQTTIQQVDSAGFFGWCDGCAAPIEGPKVRFFKLIVNERGGHRYYCTTACLHAHEDLS